MPGDTQAQDAPLVMSLSTGRLNGGVVSTQARLHDFLNYRFPRLSYRPDWYRGLDR